MINTLYAQQKKNECRRQNAKLNHMKLWLVLLRNVQLPASLCLNLLLIRFGSRCGP